MIFKRKLQRKLKKTLENLVKGDKVKVAIKPKQGCDEELLKYFRGLKGRHLDCRIIHYSHNYKTGTGTFYDKLTRKQILDLSKKPYVVNISEENPLSKVDQQQYPITY